MPEQLPSCDPSLPPPRPQSGASAGPALDPTEPIHAGMRARSIADACERLALPAILLDGTGRVLHVAPSAVPLIETHLAVAVEHLVGTSARANHWISRAVTAAIGGGEASAHDLEAKEVDCGSDAALTVTGLPVYDPSPYQMLKGLLVIARRGEGTEVRLDALRAVLATSQR